MTLCIKTGMQTEYELARKYAASDVMILTGQMTVDDLNKKVPKDCDGIISFGLCGGLAPEATIAETFIYFGVKVPPGGAPFICNPSWRARLFSKIGAKQQVCWSSGVFNTANNITERAMLFDATKCWIIDDESFAVAEYADARGIPFAGLRVVSDGAEDNLPDAIINAINLDGSTDLEAVISSVVEDPLQIPELLKTAQEANAAMVELNRVAALVGPYFQLI